MGFGDFEIIVLRYILKSQTAPADNFLIQTQGQWVVERPALLSGCGEVNGKFHGFQVNFGPKPFRTGTPRPRRCGPFFNVLVELNGLVLNILCILRMILTVILNMCIASA